MGLEENKEKVLNFLKENEQKVFNIREISENLSLSYLQTYMAVKVLAGEGKVKEEKRGRSNWISCGSLPDSWKSKK